MRVRVCVLLSVSVSVSVSGRNQSAVAEELEADCNHGAAGPVPGQEQLSQVANSSTFSAHFFIFNLKKKKEITYVLIYPLADFYVRKFEFEWKKPFGYVLRKY